MNEFDVVAMVAQTVSCFFMTGVIAVMQLTHYPSFADIKSSRFAAFHGRHAFALGIIAAPAMVVELISGAWLAQLASGFDSTAWLRLVKSNRLRTAIWITRSAVLTVWLTSTFGEPL